MGDETFSSKPLPSLFEELTWRLNFFFILPAQAEKIFIQIVVKKKLGSSGPKAAGLKCTWGPNKVERGCVKAQKLLGPSVDIGLNAFANQFAP